jgi:multidrug resistance efflux pump
MVEVLVIVYSILMWIVFKVFKVPLNKWTGTTAVLGGVASIGFLLLMMGMYHPFTKEARIYTLTTPVLPTVMGRIIEVNVKTGDRIKKGDTLFRVDPAPFQYAVDGLVAELKLVKSNLVDAQALLAKKFASPKDVERLETEIDSLEAKLASAEFQLQETNIRAESDGYMAQVRLRPGALAVAMPLKPLMTLVNDEDRFLLGGFRQNPLQNIQPGFKAEVIFTALPGKVFSASVIGMADIMGQGQLFPDDKLLSFDAVTPPGRVMVRIDIDDDLSGYQLPAGAKAYIAVYSDSWKPVAIIRQVILRVISWENYLFSFMS